MTIDVTQLVQTLEISLTQNGVTVEVALVAPPMEGHVHTWGQVMEWEGYPGDSTGGNGTADSGKLAKFGTLGDLTASSSVDVINSTGGNTFRAIFSTIGLGVVQTSGTNSGASSFLFFPSLTDQDDEFQWSLPAKSGTVAMTSDIPTTAADIGAVSSAIPTRVTRVLSFGDSITGYYQAGVAPFDAFYFGGYQAYLQQLSQGRFEYIPNAAGRAVWSYSGKSAAQLLADGSVALAAASLTGPTDAVIPLLGANDIAQQYTAAKTAANVIAVWDQFRATGAQVVGAEVLPIAVSGRRDVTTAINRILAAAAVERQMRFIPWYSVLDNFSEDFNVSDPVHPSIIGQSKMGHRAFEVVAGMLAPYASRTGFLSSNPTCSGATAGGGWIPTGFGYSASTTIEAAPLTGYVSVPNETSWLNLRLTGAATNKAITISTPPLTVFSADEYKLSAEFDVIVISGRPRFTEWTLNLRENADAAKNISDGISSIDRTFFDAASYVIPQGPRLIETPWIPKNYSGTWTSLTGYLRLALLADSVVDLRFRNVGIIGR
jgi:lysophospholipase L1-like esterase